MTEVEQLNDVSPRRLLKGQARPIDDKSGRIGLIFAPNTQKSIFSNPSAFV